MSTALSMPLRGKPDHQAIIGIGFLHLLALTAPFTYTNTGLLAFSVMVVLTSMLGVSLCYHRLLTHASFHTPRFFRYVLSVLGCLSLQGGPIRWVATHRFHHSVVEKPRDPHTPTRGMMWAHVLWNFFHDPLLSESAKLRLAPDLVKERVLVFLDRYFAWVYVLAALLAFGIFSYFCGIRTGISVVVWGFALRTVYVWHTTWLVNSVAHSHGQRSFETHDDSQNNWWVALLTFGEGWHNNHHANPRSARAGLRWYEIDLTYWFICLMKPLGLASRIVTGKH